MVASSLEVLRKKKQTNSRKKGRSWSSSHLSRNSRRAWKPLWLFAAEPVFIHNRMVLEGFQVEWLVSAGDSAFWGQQETNVNVNIQRTQNASLSRYWFHFIHYLNLQISSLTFDIVLIHIIDIFTQTFSFIFSPEQTIPHIMALALKSFGGFSMSWVGLPKFEFGGTPKPLWHLVGLVVT